MMPRRMVVCHTTSITYSNIPDTCINVVKQIPILSRWWRKKKNHSHPYRTDAECDMRNEFYEPCARERRYKMIQIIVDALKRAISLSDIRWRISNPNGRIIIINGAKCVCACVLGCNRNLNASSFPEQLINHRWRFIFQLPAQQCGIFFTFEY